MIKIHNAKTVGKRIAELRKEKRGRVRSSMSQEELAEALGYSRTQIQRYETGKVLPNESALKRFAEYFGTTVYYIKGETDIKDPKQLRASMWEIDMKVLEQMEAEIVAERKNLECVFCACGYDYEYDPTLEFGDLNTPEAVARPHLLMSYRPSGQETIYLSDEELERIVQRLGETVAFECFRIQRERELVDGDS